jgi:hypothetical protein
MPSVPWRFRPAIAPDDLLVPSRGPGEVLYHLLVPVGVEGVTIPEGRLHGIDKVDDLRWHLGKTKDLLDLLPVTSLSGVAEASQLYRCGNLTGSTRRPQ